jgi:diguanylate cyclase (GGDEF)-like protein/PAS domain S-box-containing protein
MEGDTNHGRKPGVSRQTQEFTGFVSSGRVGASDRDDPSASGAEPAVRTLWIGDDLEAFARAAAMLGELGNPTFELNQVVDEILAIETLTRVEYDVVVFSMTQDRQAWTRFCRDRRVPAVPIVYVDHEATCAERSVRRNQALLEGASGFLRGEELDGPLLEHTVFAAIERSSMRRAISEVQERFALAVRGSNDGVWEWLLESGEMHFSRRWRELLGYGVDDLANDALEWFDRVHPDDLRELREDLDAHIEGHKPYHEHEHRIRASDGSYRWVITRGVVQRNTAGRPVRMAGSLTDTSDYRLREQKLLEESRHDSLTNLPRREPFMERIRNAIDLANEYDDYAFTVLMVDVDRYRWLADSIGHQAADKMLGIVAKRITACVRPGDTVSRFGGDKFAILLDNVEELELGTHIADRIRRSVSEPIEVDGQTIYATVSIGLTTSRRGYTDGDDVINDATAAANKAKESGHDRYAVFETKMRIDALSNLRLEVALRQAVERGEFELHYQPIVELTTRRLVAFESLIRWRHPRRGLVPPAEFIPLAEQTGLIIPLGRWVLREAARQLSEWNRGLPENEWLSVSVNLSGRQVADPRLLEEIQATVEEFELPPGALKLELTESVLVKNADVVQRFLTTLRGVGVRIWVDDFGTGYSSLSYLHRFPVDGLKIDKAFVDGLDGTERSAAMVRTILSLAHNLGVEVVAEGIEEVVQAEQLRDLGCGWGQGYLFSRPVEAHSAGGLVIGRAKDAPQA